MCGDGGFFCLKLFAHINLNQSNKNVEILTGALQFEGSFIINTITLIIEKLQIYIHLFSFLTQISAFFEHVDFEITLNLF